MMAKLSALTALFGGAQAMIPLTLLTEDQYAARGAVCLDGGPPGFYFKAADPSQSTDKAAASSWILYFKGGGWCYDEQDCASRAGNQLGNSSHFPKEFSFNGIFSQTDKVEPVVAGYNHVVLWYCDGASFSGDREDPVKVGDKTIYFRGRRVLDAVLDVLLDPEGPYGLDKATQVLLSGGSAGGLATYLHADYVRSRLPASVVKYKAAPVSGFFLLHEEASGDTTYRDNMQHVFKMQNSTGGVNSDCIAAGHGSLCIFANYSYSYSKTKMYPLQSALDSWQMGNIAKIDAGCTTDQFKSCTAGAIEKLNGYAADLMADYQRTAKFSANGEGGFVESCLEHVAAQGGNWNTYEIGGVKMSDAFDEWWVASDDQEPLWHLPCDLNAEEPHQCNPSCGLPSSAITV